MKHLLRRGIYILTMAGLSLSLGCTISQPVATMTLISTKEVTPDKVDLDSLPRTRGVVGKDSTFWLLFIPFGTTRLEDAVDDALNKGNGDLMTDAVIHFRGWWFLVGQDIIEVKGDVIKTRGARTRRTKS